MEELFEKINQINSELKAIDVQSENVTRSPYYKIFGNHKEKQNDLQVIAECKKQALNDKYNLLENLQLEINKQLQQVSQLQRVSTLAIAK